MRAMIQISALLASALAPPGAPTPRFDFQWGDDIALTGFSDHLVRASFEIRAADQSWDQAVTFAIDDNPLNGFMVPRETFIQPCGEWIVSVRGYALRADELVWVSWLSESILVTSCPADLSGDCRVSTSDLNALLGAWGDPGAGDLNGDGTTGVSDLLILLGKWGPCE